MVIRFTGRGKLLVIKLPHKALKLPVFKINTQLYNIYSFTESDMCPKHINLFVGLLEIIRYGKIVKKKPKKQQPKPTPVRLA